MAKRKKAPTKKGVSKPKTPQRKGGGSKLSRSEIIQVRLDPKLRLAVELAARRQRRTVSSFVEWAVDQSVKSEVFTSERGIDLTIQEATERIWDVDEADRFINLATTFPTFLTHDEEKLWKLICELKYCWEPERDLGEDWDIRKERSKIEFEILRSTFHLFKQVVIEKIEKKDLISHLSKAQEAFIQF